MSKKARLMMEGAGAGILLLLPDLWPFLSPYHIDLYHRPLSISTVAAALAIDLFAVCLLSWGLLLLLDKSDSEQTGLVWAGILGYLIWRVVGFVILTVALSHPWMDHLRWTRIQRSALLSIIAAAILFWWLARQHFAKFVKGARFCVALFGSCIFWMLPQLVVTSFETRSQTANAFIKPALDEDPPVRGRRIIWVLLDELSYDQLFEHRQQDLALPNLDKLKNRSISFANVQPAGYFTDRVIPSLFIGREIDAIRSSFQSDLYIYEAGASHWEPFPAERTLFADAKRLGWNTGVAGWFNPYCHMLRNELDSCHWQSISPLSHHMSEEKSVTANALALPMTMVKSLCRLYSHSTQGESMVSPHGQEYTDIFNASVSLIQDERIGFMFIHLPMPHPPGAYNRKTHALGVSGTYLDNLVLADHAIGQLTDVISETAAASNTALIVSSDHSWRTVLWRAYPDWTAEEERASGGRFDPRPVLLIHFPGQSSGENIADAFPALEVHDIIDSMLHGRMQSQEDLDAWLAGYSHTVPAEKDKLAAVQP